VRVAVGAIVAVAVAVAVSITCTVIQAVCLASEAAMLLGLEVIVMKLQRSSKARQPQIQEARM
jgi:low affinity Fe/Cu permease